MKRVPARLALLACLLATTQLASPTPPTARGGGAAAAIRPPAGPASGPRVFVAGHSFHVPIAAPLAEIAASAGVGGPATPAKPQSIGGSTVTRHWDLPDDRNRAKAAIRAGQVDVLTLSPFVTLPDPAIDRFADLLLAHNPAGRVTVQASWAPRDGALLGPFANADRDRADPAALRPVVAGYADQLRAQVRAVNDRHAAAAGRPVMFVVPTGDAVVRLRERVAAGAVPGIARQSDLFRDDFGHGAAVLDVLNAYCHYAVIHGRDPAGLPPPAALGRVGLGRDVGVVNRVLQEVAWAAARAEPASGVADPADRDPTGDRDRDRVAGPGGP